MQTHNFIHRLVTENAKYMKRDACLSSIWIGNIAQTANQFWL